MELQARYSSKVLVHCHRGTSVWKGNFQGYITHPTAPRQGLIYLHHCEAATLAKEGTQSYKTDQKSFSSLIQECRLRRL